MPEVNEDLPFVLHEIGCIQRLKMIERLETTAKRMRAKEIVIGNP